MIKLIKDNEKIQIKKSYNCNSLKIKEKAANCNVNGDYKLWWTQVDIIRNLFIQHQEEIEETIRISKYLFTPIGC